MPLVSVIVPVYNAEKYIEKCLDSIVNQTFKDFEIVIIDDGSIDCSGIIADTFAEKYNNVKVFHKENQGLISARIDGLKYVQGKYIAFVDADDWIDADFLEILADSILQHDADIVVSDCIQEFNGAPVKKSNQFKAGVYESQKLVSEVYPKMLHYEGFFKFGILPYMCNKLYKKEILLGCYKNINTSIYDGEDVAVVYPYLLKCKKMVVLEDAKYHYRIHNSSMSINKKADYYENVSYLYLHLNDIFKKTEWYKVLLSQLNQYMRMMIFNGNKVAHIDSQKNIFPFDKIPKNSKIVLYGAGYVGRTYVYQVEQINYCNIIAWVDKDFRNKKLRELNVSNPRVIEVKEFDYVVIGIDDEHIKQKIKEYLIKDVGVEEKKILI